MASDSLTGAWGFSEWSTMWLPSAVLFGMTFGMIAILLVVLKRRDPVWSLAPPARNRSALRLLCAFCAASREAPARRPCAPCRAGVAAALWFCAQTCIAWRTAAASAASTFEPRLAGSSAMARAISGKPSGRLSARAGLARGRAGVVDELHEGRTERARQTGGARRCSGARAPPRSTRAPTRDSAAARATCATDWLPRSRSARIARPTAIEDGIFIGRIMAQRTLTVTWIARAGGVLPKERFSDISTGVVPADPAVKW